jgi:hypothetical protein
MIANIAPCEEHFVETFNTLNFASKSKLIENKPVIHEFSGGSWAANGPADRHAKLREWKEARETKRLSGSELASIHGAARPLKKPRPSDEAAAILHPQKVAVSEPLGANKEIKSRLDALEQKILSSNRQVAANLSSRPVLVDSTANIIGFLSPITKEKNGMAFLQRATALESKGNYRDALKDYEMASKYFSNLAELQKIHEKIQALESYLDSDPSEYEEEKENFESSSEDEGKTRKPPRKAALKLTEKSSSEKKKKKSAEAAVDLSLVDAM